MATPVFNPNQSFEEYDEPEAASAPVFDPSASFEEYDTPAEGDEPSFAPSLLTTDKGIDPLTGAKVALPGKKESTWERRLKEAQGVRPGLDPDNEFGAPTYAPDGTYIPTVANLARGAADVAARGFEYLGAGTNTVLDYIDKAAEDSGLADALSWEGNKFLPGSAIGALGEAFPLGGVEGGMITPSPRAAKLTPEAEAGYLEVSRVGSSDDILNYAAEQGFTVDKNTVDQFVKERDKAGTINPEVTYREQLDLPLEEQQTFVFDGPTPEQRALEAKLQGEADAFLSKKREEEGSQPDYRQRELPLEIPAQQRSFDFGEEAPVQKAIVSRDIVEDVPVSKDVEDAVSYINDLSSSWENTPSIEVFDNFNDLEGVDPDAIGVIRADNSIAINMDAVKKEAEGLGVTPQDVLSSVTFHESLGHYGLSERFGEGLTDFMLGLYNNSDSFKRRVNARMESNPDEYEDAINPIAAHAEEILSEMSEQGQISPTLMRRLKDMIKGYGREMGFQIKYSDAEIKSILSTAHDAVVKGDRKGRGSSVGSLTNRYRSPEDLTPEERVSQRKEKKTLDKVANFHNANAEIGKTTFTRPYSEEPHTWSFSYTDKEGRPITGAYEISPEGNIIEFSVGLSSGTPGQIGPAAVRQIARDIKKNHPDAKTLDGVRISGARKAAGKDKEDVSIGMLRYMKRRTLGKDEGQTRRGSRNDPERTDETPRTIIPNYASKRNVEGILEEITPEKTPETWEDWIDEAGNLKMTGKIAQNLAVGAEVPQLLAAEKYLLESANRIYDLSSKVSKGNATEREIFLLGAEMDRAHNVANSIQEVVTNAARLLNSRNIGIASDKALSDGVRNMLTSLSKADLSDPAKVQDAANKLAKLGAKEKKIATALDLLGNALNLPRSIMSSMDLSAPLRQGIFFVGRKELWKNIPEMMRYAFKQEKFDNAMLGIEKSPYYPLMEKAGLAITEVGKNLTAREEAFMSDWAQHIPGIGKVIKGSERAYSGFLNKLRADVFNDLVRQYEDAGIDLKKDPKALKDMAKFINNATGRGDLGKFNQASPILSGLFFSPRLIASRVRMLNPATYTKLDPIVRKNALKSLASFGGIATTVLTLAKMAGAEVETDPRSSDFAKIKTGNTRYDILGGFGQYLTLASRLATNEKKNAKGEVNTLGEKYGADTRLDVLLNFGINKESPIASFVTDYLRGANAIGEPFDAKKKALESFIPLFLQDAAEVVKEEGAKGIPMALPGLFGVGTQTYDIDLGYDAFGRDIEALRQSEEEESDPVVLEVQRLISSNASDFKGLPEAPSSFTEEGTKYPLSEEQKKEWQRIMGGYTHEYLTEDMSSEDYMLGTEEEKADIIEKAHKDAFEDTKADFLDNMEATGEE